MSALLARAAVSLSFGFCRNPDAARLPDTQPVPFPTHDKTTKPLI